MVGLESKKTGTLSYTLCFERTTYVFNNWRGDSWGNCARDTILFHLKDFCPFRFYLNKSFWTQHAHVLPEICQIVTFVQKRQSTGTSEMRSHQLNVLGHLLKVCLYQVSQDWGRVQRGGETWPLQSRFHEGCQIGISCPCLRNLKHLHNCIATLSQAPLHQVYSNPKAIEHLFKDLANKSPARTVLSKSGRGGINGGGQYFLTPAIAVQPLVGGFFQTRGVGCLHFD